MPIPLYLDAARMGQMSPSTRWALSEFVRFAGEYGGTLYFEDFLRHGFDALSGQLQQDHIGLKTWQGIEELLHILKVHVGLSNGPMPLLASRTANLVRLGARALFSGGNRVLITDLTWPSYERILRKEATKFDARLVKLSVRDAILEGGIGPEDVAQRVAQAVIRYKCQGLFLPAVSHDGIRFPLELLGTILSQGKARPFVVVDGAQAFCHVPLELGKMACDFLLTGSHKWLGAYVPLGIGFATRAGSKSLNLRRGSGDPLLNFLGELRNDAENRFGETVNLMPLFACRAALANRANIAQDFAIRKSNADTLAGAISGRWKAIRPHPRMRSGILLVEATAPRVQCVPAARLRAHFLTRGISLTAYDGGRLRLAMPSTPFSSVEIECLIQSLHEAENEHSMRATQTHAIALDCK